MIHVNQKATHSPRDVFSISLRISLGKYVAWRKGKKTEVSHFGKKVWKNDLAKICVELSGFLLKDASCDQRMLQNMAKSPNSFIATLKLLRS